jgi:hypothetical protein
MSCVSPALRVIISKSLWVSKLRRKPDGSRIAAPWQATSRFKVKFELILMDFRGLAEPVQG